MPRIVTLLAAATEIVAAIGAADQLVGVSHECDHPPEAVAGRPVVTTARIGPPSSSAGVDRSVRQLVRDALAVYDIDTQQLAALAPEVIITQDLCRVCAVDATDVRTAVARLTAVSGVELVTLHPRRLEEVLGNINQVATVVGRPADGQHVVAGLRERIGQVRAATAVGGDRPREVTVEWIQPVMLGGLWMPELVTLAGGEPLGVTAGEMAPTPGWEELAGLTPEVVVVKPCGFTVERTLTELPVLERTLPWAAWTAPGRPARVYVADGNAYFNRSGPRLVDSLELLAALVHPDRFPPPPPEHAVRIGPGLEILPL